MNTGTNRWAIVIAAIFMQLALGAVYAWSVFVIPLRNVNQNWNVTDVTLTFTLAIFFLGIGSTIGGFWMDKKGPRVVATAAGICYGLGVFLSGFAGPNLTWLWISYGFLGGLGMGLGYIVPVATLVKWFPDRRGLITGLAVGGFGAGALITAPAATALIGSVGVYQTFSILGIIYFIFVVVAAQFYKNPPAGYKPAGWEPTAAQVSQRATRDYTLGEALQTWQWYALWAILCLNVSAGIMLISQASPMAQNITGVSASVAAGLVSSIAIFNGGGRVFWAWLSDIITRRKVFITMFLLQFVLFLVMTQTRSFAVFTVLALIVALCYGGGFGTMPSFCADYFGPKYTGFVYGTMITAWGVGGILGPILIARIKDLTGGYTQAMYIIAGVMLVSTILPLIVRPPDRAAARQAAPTAAPAGA
ncbi:MAG TPA: OFA family MFS transporter [Chloroflexota bacterium]|nr:OFA family MFS transporter [Chloroflexota bacterium]